MADVNEDDQNPSSDEVDDIQRAWLRERPGTPVSSIGVITRIWRIGKLLDEDRRRTMLALDMDAATRDLLSAVRRSGPPYRLSAGEIASRMMVSAGAVSQRVARAERAGYVRRVRSPDDGRGVFVELTERGHDLIERTVDQLLRHEEDLLAGLSDRQRDDLTELLRILHADLTARAAAHED